MLKRFILLETELRDLHLAHSDKFVGVPFPSLEELEHLKTVVFPTFEEADRLCKALQTEELTLAAGRAMVNKFVTKQGVVSSYLSDTIPDRSNASSYVVKIKTFESAICKLQLSKLGKSLEPLTSAEITSLSKFRKKAIVPAETTKKSYENEYLSVLSEEVGGIHLDYENFMAVPCTSNICERLFSRAKLVLGDLRGKMTPEHVETILFLQYNRDLWDLSTVEHIFNGQEDEILNAEALQPQATAVDEELDLQIEN
jgi:hypothetical protein